MARATRFAAAAAIVTLVVSAASGDPRSSSDRLKIVALGDSLTSGHGLSPAQAYPALLQARLKDAGLPFLVVNRGVSGDTTAGGVRRLEAALADEPQILIVELGANDGLRGVPVTTVRRNLEDILDTAQERGIDVLLCGMEAPPLHGWQYTVDFHLMFASLTAKYHVSFVPFLLIDVLGNPKLMSPDGIHPNAAGTRVMADTIWQALKPMAERRARSNLPI